MTKNQNLQTSNFNDIPNDHYRVIYADPPWEFKTRSKKGEGKSAQNHYQCMNFDDLKVIPVNCIGAKNSIMFMWATKPLLPKQINLMECWGYEYKTIGFDWLKLNPKALTPFIGLGYYSRANMEYCLIGVKGSVGRPKDKGISSVVMQPIREHSRKPDNIRYLIQRMFDGPYIELFARTTIEGWDCWGNETNKFISNTSLF